ncbi:MAG: helix-turn-helix domain-containing protein [Nibricoccus sp.]
MQSIGERLEEARKRKGISIREAAEATKIRGDYLHKFESNQYDIKLPEIYVRGFLRTYANYLKLPGEKIINDYNGLGLNESKQRSLNREVYGRMDISHSSGKADKAAKEPGADAPAAESSASTEAASRNPATFVPQGGGGAISIDKKLLIKFGAIAGAALLVLIIGIWAVFSLMGRSSSPKSSANPGEVWVKPTEGEASFALVAKGPVTVTVTSIKDGTTLYKGTIPLGDTRAIPRRGHARVTASPPQNLEFNFGGTPYPMSAGGSVDIDKPPTPAR